MPKTKKPEPKTPTQAEIDYAAEIIKLKDAEPNKNTNKYIKTLIEEATIKVKKEAYSSGFWTGFVMGVLIAFIMWTFLTF
jgi:hypothetical protein